MSFAFSLEATVAGCSISLSRAQVSNDLHDENETDALAEAMIEMARLQRGPSQMCRLMAKVELTGLFTREINSRCIGHCLIASPNIVAIIYFFEIYVDICFFQFTVSSGNWWDELWARRLAKISAA